MPWLHLCGLTFSWITFFQRIVRSDIGLFLIAPSTSTIKVLGITNMITRTRCRPFKQLWTILMLPSLKLHAHKTMETCRICASWPNICSNSSVHLFSSFSQDMTHSKFPTFFNRNAPKWVTAQQTNWQIFTLIILTSKIGSENLWNLSLILLFGHLHALSIAISIVAATETAKLCRYLWIQDTHLKELWRCSLLEWRMTFISGFGSTTSCGLRIPHALSLVSTIMMTLH